jgi:hypothetical protein
MLGTVARAFGQTFLLLQRCKDAVLWPGTVAAVLALAELPSGTANTDAEAVPKSEASQL